jgi:hypothetical protein
VSESNKTSRCVKAIKLCRDIAFTHREVLLFSTFHSRQSFTAFTQCEVVLLSTFHSPQSLIAFTHREQ